MLEVYTQYDKVSKRHKPTKDDMTVWNEEYITISIYNKYRQQFMSNADKIGDYLYRYYLSKMFNNGNICTLKNAVER